MVDFSKKLNPQPEEEPPKIRGTIARIIYHQNAFLIAKLDGGITIKGSMVCPEEGLNYEFEGRWVDDPNYGRQFLFKSFVAHYPLGQHGIETYLNKNCPGIGPATATAIFDTYGDDAIEILKRDPERVADEIRGITAEKAELISEALQAREHLEVAEPVLRELFKDMPIRQNVIAGILDLWGAEAPAVIKEDPYRLTTAIRGVGFPTADAIAERLGFQMNGVPRIRAGLLYLIEQAAQGFVPGIGSGHTFLPCNTLVDCAVELLTLDPDKIKPVIDILAEEKEVRLIGDRVYSLALWEAEVNIASRLRHLLASSVRPPERAISELRSSDGLTISGVADSDTGLFPDQLEALKGSIDSSVFILCGGAGTGKSHVVKAMLELFGGRYELSAPTGKAAKRLGEMTGAPAQTIHRLLESKPVTTYKDGRHRTSWVFRRNELEPIQADVIVVDEFSMCDTRLMSSFIDAVEPGTRLILVGDPYQLPSVGPGNVLNEMVRSGAVPAVELESIKRQDPDKLIVANALQIRNGHDIQVRNTSTSDFFFIEESDLESIVKTTVDVVTRRLPSKYRFNPFSDIQTITARREKGDGSATDFNERIQAVINPNHKKPGKIHTGDRVIQTRNDYKINIMNGDQGVVTFAGPRLLTVQFDFPEKIVDIPLVGNDLRLSYAITTHKCIAPDTLVETPRGLVEIRELEHSGTIGTPSGPRCYHSLVCRGEARMLRVTTREGYRLSVTPEHGLDVWNGTRYERVEARSIRVGDFVRLRLGMTCDVDAAPALPSPPAVDVRSKVHCLPEVATEELCEFLGLMVADGTVFRSGFRLAKRHADVVDRFEELCRSLFGCVTRRCQVEGAEAVEVCSTQLSDWLTSLGGLEPRAKSIPSVVMRSPLQLQARFLRGLFEDGTVSVKSGRMDHVELSNSSAPLLRVVQVMLLRFGIISSVRDSVPVPRLYIYSESAKRFAEQVGFVSAFKRARCGLPAWRCGYAVPVDRLVTASMGTSSRQNARHSGVLSRSKYVEELGETAHTEDWHHSRVADVKEFVGESMCVEIPDGHQFLQNGFAGWNSQGSQWPAVVIPVHDSFGTMLLQRHWLYTAVTRGERLCVVVGQRKLIQTIVERAHGLRRFSGLRDMLGDVDLVPTT